MIKNFLKNKKIILTAIAVIVLVAMVAPQVAKAQEALKTDSSLLIKDSASYGLIGNLLMSLVGRLLAMAAVAVDFAIKLGNDILILDAVQTGWKIMLQFTNLGFILGIIIIAFATILHLESYALKQILWKLIVAAILVNFSLVIAGAFISISNITSDYFIKATSTSNLAEALGNAIQPQTFQKPPSTTGEAVINWFKDNLSPASWMKYLINIFFIVIFGFLAALTLLTLFIMLLVRVIALIFILILSPIIWLCWIFPSTEKYWTQWWDQFIKWNFFAPAVLFFVYLSVSTAQQLDRANQTLPSLRWLKTTPIISSLDSFFGINDFIYTALRLIVILSLLIGGIFIANKFGIAGGSIGVNMASKVGKGVSGWAGRRTKLWGRAGYSAIAQKTGLMERSENLSKKAATSTGLKRFAYGLAARGVATLSAGAEREPKQYEQKYKGMTTRQVMAALSITFGAEKTVALKEFVSRPDVPLKGKERAQYLAQVGVNDKGKNTFKKYGLDFSDVEKKSGISAGMGTALNNKDAKGFSNEANAFIGSLKNKDAGDVGKTLKHFFDDPTFKIKDDDQKTAANYIADALAQKNPTFASKVIPHIGGFDMVKKFSMEINTVFDRLIDEAYEKGDNKKFDEYNKHKDYFGAALIHNMSSTWGAEEEKNGEKGAESKGKEEKKS